MKIWAALTIILIIAGCATAPVIPPELQYAAPASPSGSLASIAGSQENSALLDNLTTYVIAVDGKRVMAERTRWNLALPILAGQRSISVAFQRGAYNAQADLPLQAVAGVQYQVRFSSDVHFNGANTYCDFWIVDAVSQKPVTEIRRGIIGSGRQTAIPIFIPVR